MTVTAVERDLDACTLTITADYDAPPTRVWQLWADPRQLEQWWGPPTYPATVTDHDLTAGGTVRYFMTGPEGDKHGGWWKVLAADPPHSLEFEDGFATDSGEPNPDLPVTRSRVTFEERDGGGTRMTLEGSFPSQEAMEQMISMGMEEGIQEAMGQIDAILAAG